MYDKKGRLTQPGYYQHLKRYDMGAERFTDDKGKGIKVKLQISDMNMVSVFQLLIIVLSLCIKKSSRFQYSSAQTPQRTLKQLTKPTSVA